MQNPWPETVPVIHCQRGQKVGFVCQLPQITGALFLCRVLG